MITTIKKTQPEQVAENRWEGEGGLVPEGAPVSEKEPTETPVEVNSVHSKEL